MRLRLEMPKQSPKMEQIFGAMEQGWTQAYINDALYDARVLWGLIGNNARYMMDPREKFYFCDMPYHGRLDTSKTVTQADYDKSYWRFCKQGFHDNRELNVPSDRFESWNVKPLPYENGDHILLCPSSETLTQFIHGMSVDQWITQVTQHLKAKTNRLILVRRKPRGKGTSGPSVATHPIEDDLKHAHSVVVSASLSAIDALKLGKPVYSTSPEHCPAAWCSTNFLNWHEKTPFKDRETLFNNLGFKQFSIEEFRNGTAYDLWNEYLR